MIIVNLDVMLAKRKMKSNELADKIGITTANLSILKTGKAKAIRFTTFEAIYVLLFNLIKIYYHTINILITKLRKKAETHTESLLFYMLNSSN